MTIRCLDAKILCVDKTFGAKIRHLRRSFRLTQQQLAERAGLTQATISGIEVGRHSAQRSTLTLIAQALGLSILEVEDYLYRDKPISQRITSPEPSRGARHPNWPKGKIPLVDRLPAGNGGAAFADFEGKWADEFVDRGMAGENAIAFRVEGDSMAPLIPEGCIVRADPDVKAWDGAVVAVQLTAAANEANMVKRLTILPDGTYRFSADNPRAGYEPLVVRRDDVAWMGVVVSMEVRLQ